MHVYIIHVYHVSSAQIGRTPLFSASGKGHVAVVLLLIENGADISICNEVYVYIYTCIRESGHDRLSM